MPASRHSIAQSRHRPTAPDTVTRACRVRFDAARTTEKGAGSCQHPSPPDTFGHIGTLSPDHSGRSPFLALPWSRPAPRYNSAEYATFAYLPRVGYATCSLGAMGVQTHHQDQCTRWSGILLIIACWYIQTASMIGSQLFNIHREKGPQPPLQLSPARNSNASARAAAPPEWVSRVERGDNLPGRPLARVTRQEASNKDTLSCWNPARGGPGALERSTSERMPRPPSPLRPNRRGRADFLFPTAAGTSRRRCSPR